jgi:hypothetical protein
MDEERARSLLELVAADQPPPARVDVGRAREAGRRRLRWRQAGLAGTPALAAVAVAAIAFSAAQVPPAGGQRPGGTITGAHPGRVIAQHVSPPLRFDPLVPYAAFGWLPRGVTLDGGQIAPTYAYLTAGHRAWSLTVYVTGRCDKSAAQLLWQLRRREQPLMNCSTSDSSGWTGPVGSVAGTVDGRTAFWTTPATELLWPYARGSWAVLQLPHRRDHRVALMIARHIRYAVAAKPSIEFPAQLTGLPAAWKVGFTYFVADAGVLRASQYTLNAPGNDAPSLTTDPATKHSTCYFYPHGQSARRTINGYKVIVNHLRGPIVQVCAAHADGLMVFISTYGTQRPDAVALFARHLHLLGTSPAGWTVQPVR